MGFGGCAANRLIGAKKVKPRTVSQPPCGTGAAWMAYIYYAGSQLEDASSWGVALTSVAMSPHRNTCGQSLPPSLTMTSSHTWTALIAIPISHKCSLHISSPAPARGNEALSRPKWNAFLILQAKRALIDHGVLGTRGDGGYRDFTAGCGEACW